MTGGVPAPWRAVGPVSQAVVRPSLWAALDVPFKLALALLVVLLPIWIGGVYAARDPLDPLTWVLPASLVLFVEAAPAALFALLPAVQLAFTRYIVDDTGIRTRMQIVSRREAVVSWPKVTAVLHRRTLLDRVFGIARLDVIAYGERGTTLHLVGLRNAPELRDLVARKMREHATVESLLRND